MRLLILAFLFIACCPATGHATTPAARRIAAPAPVTIVILPFDNALPRPFKSLDEGMPDLVTACFSAYDGAAEILDRGALEGISREKTLNFDPGAYRQLRGATHVLRGSLAPQDGGFLMTLMLYDISSAELVASASAAGNSASAADTACAGVKDLVSSLHSVKVAEGSKESIDPEQALQSRLMIEGLGHYYNGAYDKAFPAFMKAVKADPANAAAVYWLGCSYRDAGMDDFARIEFSQFLEKFPKDPRAAEVRHYLAPEKDSPPSPKQGSAP